MKKRLWIGITAATVTAAVILGLLFFGGFFLPKEAKAYNKAIAQLKEKDSVTFDITQTTTTKVGDEVTELKVYQTLTYSELQSKSPIIQLEETFPIVSPSEKYTEYCNKNTLYVEAGESAAFQGVLSKKEAKYRYVPIKMLNILGYKKVKVEISTAKQFIIDGKVINVETNEVTKKTVSFESPKSRFAERWALPIGAKLVTASGSVQMDKDGKLLKTQYTITYTQGSAEIMVDTVSKPREKAREIALPTDTGRFVELSFVDAPRAVAYSKARLRSLSSAMISSTEYIRKEYDGQLLTAGNSLKAQDIALYNTDDGLQYAVVSATSNNNVSILYQNGIYYISDAGNSEPARYRLDKATARLRLFEDLTLQVPDFQYWEDVTLTDLNGVYFLEFTYNAQYKKEFQTSACGSHTSHSLKELTGYLALDKSTLAVTAAGTHSECDHPDNGGTQTTLRQQNMIVETPSLGAYQALTGKLPKEAEPEEKATPLFYRVTGKEGQEMWLLGTIHVGDARTAYLPEEIYDAFADSDALALEMDAEKFEEQLETDTALQEAMAGAYFYDDGSEIEDHLEDEVYELALKYMKASGNYNQNAPYMKTSVWESAIGEFFLQLGHGLSSDLGVEMRLTELANKMNKPIREVESGQAQIQMLTGWSDELQEMLLVSTVGGGPAAYNMSSEMLYELWCAGNEKALRKQVNLEGSTAGMSKAEREEYQKYMDEYDKTMNTDRNAKMLDVAISYLESGDTVFYAVGLAHLLNDTNGLVDALRQAGYTVEQVQYS